MILSDDYSFPSLTVMDGFLVNSARYKDPKTNQLSKEKLEKQYTLWDKLFSGTHPLSFGENDQVLPGPASDYHEPDQ